MSISRVFDLFVNLWNKVYLLFELNKSKRVTYRQYVKCFFASVYEPLYNTSSHLIKEKRKEMNYNHPLAISIAVKGTVGLRRKKQLYEI